MTLSATKATDSSRHVVLALGLTVFLQWLGASALIPLLPLWVRHNGGTDSLAGAVMGAYFLAGLLTQVPAGRMADRFGKHTILYVGLVLYTAGTLAFLTPFGPWSDVLWRFLQGVGAGAAAVAALAIVGEVTPPDGRGRAFGIVYAGELGGLAVGPLLGSLLGVSHMRTLFLAAAAGAIVACLPTLLVGRRTQVARREATSEQDQGSRHHPEPESLWRRAISGAVVAAVAAGLLVGVYEVCWTLLLRSRGAATWQIGLSWTLFAVPFVVVSVPAGRIADRFDRRVLVIGGLISSACFAITYPLLHDVALLVGLGALEALGVALMLPAVQSIITEHAPPSRLGRSQGLFATGETAATALSASVAGWMFGASPWLPFVTMALCAAAVTMSLPFIWAPVRGRVEVGPAPASA